MLLEASMSLCLQFPLPRIPLHNVAWTTLIHPLRLNSDITYSVNISLITIVLFNILQRNRANGISR